MNTLSDISAKMALSLTRGINTLRIASTVADGETITIGGVTYTYKTAVVTPASQILIGANAAATVVNTQAFFAAQAESGFWVERISATELLFESFSGSIPPTQGNAAATGVLTSTANYVNGDTITIDVITYTFKAALTGALHEILIGANEAASIANFAALLNGSGTAGINYSLNEPKSPKVSAVAAAHTLTVTALRAGTLNNDLPTTETAANASWGAATLAGGTDIAYFAETMAGANNAWASPAFYGGVPASATGRAFILTSRVPNAQEIALKSMHFLFGFYPKVAIVQVRDSTGTFKAYDGQTVISGHRVSTSDAAGSVALAANDLVTVFASE